MKRLLALAAISAALITGAIAAKTSGPEPIPPGFDFPQKRAVIDGWVAKNNVAAERNHAWEMWAGMTAPSHEAGLPIWETWESDAQVFKAFSAKLLAESPAALRHPFRRPQQFIHLDQVRSLLKAAPKPEQVVAFNKFDPASAKFLDTAHPTPPKAAASYRYTQRADLAKLNAAWPTTTKVIDRKIDEFPVAALDLKPVFWLIKQKGLTALPLWQGASQSSAPGNPTPETWFTCVLIDPNGPASQTKATPATPAQVAAANSNPGLACKPAQYQYAPLSMLYSFSLDAAEAAAFNQAQGGSAVAGDFAALVAMHTTSKEIVNWTWQTFWWSAGANPPEKFPGSFDDISPKVKAPWSYYAMCTAYSMVQPATDAKGKPVVCFNPFLETGLPDGLDSNCMSCHGTARAPAPSGFPYPTTYLPNGYVDFGDPKLFGGSTRADFVWAIPFKAL